MVNASLKDFHSPGWEGAPATERKREQGDGRPAEPPEYQDAGEFFNRTYMTEGFDDAAMRTISENSRTLNFDAHDFEE